MILTSTFDRTLSIPGILVYDPVKDEWNVTNVILPSARQGSCAVVANDKIILTGGKGHMEDLTGSNQVWEFDPQAVKWNHNGNWPKMNRPRYYHGCTVGELANEKGCVLVYSAYISLYADA